MVSEDHATPIFRVKTAWSSEALVSLKSLRADHDLYVPCSFKMKHDKVVPVL
jgi:hypothetical protein